MAKPTRVYHANITRRGDIKKIQDELRSTKERFRRVEARFFKTFAYRATKIIRQEIVNQNPRYNSNLTAAVSWEMVSPVRLRLFMANEKDGPIYFEFGTGPKGAASPHPNPPAYWKYGPAWGSYETTIGKDLQALYGIPKVPFKNGPGYILKGQRAHPFWETAMEQIFTKKFIRECWEDAKHNG